MYFRLDRVVAVSVVVGADRPYLGVALGSGLLLELERAMAVWAVVLLARVVGDQALRGRLPDEIGGRGVRYAAREELAVVTETRLKRVTTSPTVSAPWKSRLRNSGNGHRVLER